MTDPQHSAPDRVPLTVDDFAFDGPLGSDGAQIEQVGVNHFHIALGAAPGHPQWPNMLGFSITGHARGNPLHLEVSFAHGPSMAFNSYPLAWSSDGETWQLVSWQRGHTQSPQHDAVHFAPFPTDRIEVGTQTPLAYEHSLRWIERWCEHPHVAQHCLGHSLGGRKLIRLEITDPDSPHPRCERWVHYITHQHPGEQHAQWRTIGMIRWLLSDHPAAADFRRRSICHVLLWMSPDSPSHGWYRVNAQGVDMNRSYRAAGADVTQQAHEAYLCQRDLEQLMASDAPVTSLWAMHTWQGLVEPLLRRGPEFGTTLGSWTDLRQAIIDCDPDSLIKPLALREAPVTDASTWTAGPHLQFGISTILCEGASHLDQHQNLNSGESLIRGVAGFYVGTRRD